MRATRDHGCKRSGGFTGAASRGHRARGPGEIDRMWDSSSDNLTRHWWFSENLFNLASSQSAAVNQSTRDWLRDRLAVSFSSVTAINIEFRLGLEPLFLLSRPGACRCPGFRELLAPVAQAPAKPARITRKNTTPFFRVKRPNISCHLFRRIGYRTPSGPNGPGSGTPRLRHLMSLQTRSHYQADAASDSGWTGVTVAGLGKNPLT